MVPTTVDEPLPPDIRPPRRIPQNDYQAVDVRRPCWESAGVLARTSPLLLAAAAFATFPSALAAPSAPAQHRVDGPPPAYNQAHVRARPSPILSLLRVLWRWAATPATATHTHTKRHMDSTQVVEACMIPVLVCLSGVFAGLTLGYFSVDQTQLQVLSISGTPRQQAYARRIMPIRKDSHLLLTTLILGNMIVNEALPVITDGVLGGGIYAVIISTALVVIFAEIIPQSVCSRYGLKIGAGAAPAVRVLIVLFFPLAWPIAKLLEYILGAHHGIMYRRRELRELIRLHSAAADGGGDLDLDTVTIAQGALDLAHKTVADAMTPIHDVFMLPLHATLDYETLGRVVASGHSRIPVYEVVDVPDGHGGTRQVDKVLGCMLVKACVLLDPEDATPLASIPINSVPSVPHDEPLTNMLNAFQEGRSHMAIVSRRGRAEAAQILEPGASPTPTAAEGLRQRLMRKVARLGSAESSASDASTSTDSEGEKVAARTDVECTAGGVPADAVPPVPTPDPLEFADPAPLGIITLEDVLEELIGEEIWDEYDGGAVVRSPASSYVPPEAREALARARARAVGKGGDATTASSSPAAVAAAAATARPAPPRLKLPITLLGIRPASLPGRARTPTMTTAAASPAVVEVKLPASSATPTDAGSAKALLPVSAPVPHRSPSAPILNVAAVRDIPETHAIPGGAGRRTPKFKSAPLKSTPATTAPLTTVATGDTPSISPTRPAAGHM